MTQADLGQSVASNGAPACSADVNAVGLHAERLINLYPSTPAVITRDEGLMLYRDMVLGRRFEDKCAEMYYRGKMFGFVHLYNGQEAVSTGVIKAMKMQYDWFCSTYRDHVHALSCGVPACEYQRRNWVRSTPEASSMAHTKSSQVTACPSWRSKYRSLPRRNASGPSSV